MFVEREDLALSPQGAVSVGFFGICYKTATVLVSAGGGR